MMDLVGEADKYFRMTSNIADQPLPRHLTHQATLRELLTEHLDIRCSPRRSFFEWLRRISQDEREQERLDDFLSDPVGDLAINWADDRMKSSPMLLDLRGRFSRRWETFARQSFLYRIYWRFSPRFAGGSFRSPVRRK